MANMIITPNMIMIYEAVEYKTSISNLVKYLVLSLHFKILKNPQVVENRMTMKWSRSLKLAGPGLFKCKYP